MPDSGGDESTTIDSPNGAAGKEELITQLQKENHSLQERLTLLQIQNERLEKQQENQRQQQQQRQKQKSNGRRLILEDFEGEGVPSVDARGDAVDGWNSRERRYTEPWDNYVPPPSQFRAGSDLEGGYDEDYDELGLSPPPSTFSEAEDEICEYDERTDKWKSGGLGECPVEPNVTFVDAMKSRAAWLVGLLVMQSCSGFILSRNEMLLQDHPVIVYFLTMLVGAGGNAGNQASVRVIRGLGE